jgi:hypothetical protein
MSYRALGQTTVTTVTRTEEVPTAVFSASEMSDTAKYAVGIGAFAVLGGLGWLAYRYPNPMFGVGGWGVGYGYGSGRPGVMLTMNRARRKRRRS